MTEGNQVIDLSEVTQEDLVNLRDKNQQRLLAVRNQGVQLGNFGEVVLNNRLEVFLELFISPAQRIQFEYAFEKRMEEVLLDVLSKIRTAELTQGTGKLIIPGR